MTDTAIDNVWEEGGDVTFHIIIKVPVQAANPEFNRDDVIAHAVSTLGEIAEHAESHHNVTLVAPFEPMNVEPWE